MEWLGWLHGALRIKLEHEALSAVRIGLQSPKPCDITSPILASARPRLPGPPLRPPASCCRYLPHIGRVTIIMNDYPMFKYALIAVLGIFVLTSKE